MHRHWLIEKLERYRIAEPHDQVHRDRILQFVKQHPDCFDRSLGIGHITGSAWIVNRNRDRFLLTFHRKLNMWLQLGGHADGNGNVAEVALNEAREESGLDEVRLLSDEIFDVDVHLIPEYKGLAEHHHYDVRFLVEADDSQGLKISDESHDLRWLSEIELKTLTTEESILRMLRKSLNHE